ncbi:alpha/beta hydrolase-fold protein [Sphingomonas sp. TDK1]|uniref:alpha/beta hydrolase-fold protein n=1 Tax=Sphingomonas sp. TDK1 TaxID=453247 RepID=UPI0007D9390D|nr:alpha/beta hydrolase-fold protein [Sphingomonas sp. TDK1]OAN58438.1 enterochelin esterase [Sphingomonas sp. TDK1]
MRRSAILVGALLLGAAAPGPDPISVPVAVAPALGAHFSGRLIVFVEKTPDSPSPDSPIDFSPFQPSGATLAAREVIDLQPGRIASVDGETDVFPAPISTLPAGRYRAQVILDRDHDYNYSGRGPGDLVSKTVTFSLPGKIPVLTLDEELRPAKDDGPDLEHVPPAMRTRLAAVVAKVQPIDFQSPSLTAFRGAPTNIRGWVALPPGYDGTKRFPTIYTDGGFGSTLATARINAMMVTADMAECNLPPMIWVFLDHSGPTGTNEFADSANNGPWGRALTGDLIPALEQRYAMDAKPSGRFLTGHSSGGWSTLWLQVRYPKLFGGSWPTSPDPADFHDFTNVDLYRTDANFYHGADGKPLPIVRMDGKVVATTEQFARAEAVLGLAGGQIASFEWVFSPRGANGQPVPLFDRATGKVDPAVVAYWREQYDVAHIVTRDAAKLKPDLSGKLHLIVGTADTFYLDGPAHRLEAAMRAAGIPASFTFVPGRTHFDLYARDGDRSALLKDIAWQMYAVARPGAVRPKP